MVVDGIIRETMKSAAGLDLRSRRLDERRQVRPAAAAPCSGGAPCSGAAPCSGGAKRASRARAFLWFAAALSIVALHRAAQAKAFELSDHRWEGMSTFLDVLRAEAGDARVVPTYKLDWDQITPNDAILVVHPDHPLDPDSLGAFLNEGGRAAVLDDFGAGDRILSRFEIARIPPPARPFATIRNNPELAIAEPPPATVDHPPHPAVQGVDRVITNHPTGLRHPKLATLLTIRAVDGPDVDVAVAGVVGKGRLLAVSDPSLFINQMLRYPGNRTFASTLARYLLDDASTGRHGQRLFLLVNHFSEGGAFGQQKTFAELAARRATSAAHALESAFAGGLPATMALAFATMIAGGVAAFAMARHGRPYRHRSPRFVRPLPAVGRGGLAGRAAVLSAPSTPAALVLLELKAALEDELRDRLRADGSPPTSTLVDLARAQGVLDEPTAAELKRFFLGMATLETQVAAGQIPRLGRRAVSRLTRSFHRFLAELDRAGADVLAASGAPDAPSGATAAWGGSAGAREGAA